MDTYDEIPYESIPFNDTHPTNLAVLGRLFGLDTPNPEHCRVLELGCASGGNLIPMAWYLRESKFLGVELSKAQAAAGVTLIDQLGLKNIEIRQGDILGLDARLGQFDYVLVHGVYSWVPKQVRDKIMHICSAHLTEHGMAYISYNTLPGWRMKGVLRDMLRYHTRRAATPSQKIASSLDLLEKMHTALDGLDSPSAQYLQNEISYLRNAHPSYLYHEYMEVINQPFLFTQFVEHAQRYDLQYLCDVDLQAMFPSTLGEHAQALIEAFDDLLEQEQYIDFIRNRNFRQTLLCHADQPLEREISIETFENFAYYSDLSPTGELDLKITHDAVFVSFSGTEFPVSHPLTKAALVYLRQIYPDSVSFSTLTREAQSLLIDEGGKKYVEQVDQLGRELFTLYVHQAIGASLHAQEFSHEPPFHPKATALARVQAANALGHLATARHSVIQVDAFSTRFVTYLDGSLTFDQLVDHMTEDIRMGRLSIPNEDLSTLEPNWLETKVSANCDRLLSLFAENGILED